MCWFGQQWHNSLQDLLRKKCNTTNRLSITSTSALTSVVLQFLPLGHRFLNKLRSNMHTVTGSHSIKLTIAFRRVNQPLLTSSNLHKLKSTTQNTYHMTLTLANRHPNYIRTNQILSNCLLFDLIGLDHSRQVLLQESVITLHFLPEQKIPWLLAYQTTFQAASLPIKFCQTTFPFDLIRSA